MKVAFDLEGHNGKMWLFRQDTRCGNVTHRHAELEVNVIVSGRCTYLIEGRAYVLTRHSLLWLFPAQEHVILNFSANFELWVAIFEPKLVARLVRRAADRTLLENNPPGHYCRWLRPERTAWLDSLFGEVRAVHSLPHQFKAGLAHILLAAWTEYQRGTDTPAGTDVHPAVERAIRLIEQSPSVESLEDVAGEVGLSASRLSSLFKQQTGMALVDFRSRKRLQRFLRDYGSGQRNNMLEVALEAGFGSYTQFHRTFRQFMRCSPQEYRRRLTS